MLWVDRVVFKLSILDGIYLDISMNFIFSMFDGINNNELQVINNKIII